MIRETFRGDMSDLMIKLSGIMWNYESAHNLNRSIDKSICFTKDLICYGDKKQEIAELMSKELDKTIDKLRSSSIETLHNLFLRDRAILEDDNPKAKERLKIIYEAFKSERNHRIRNEIENLIFSLNSEDCKSKFSHCVSEIDYNERNVKYINEQSKDPKRCKELIDT